MLLAALAAGGWLWKSGQWETLKAKLPAVFQKQAAKPAEKAADAKKKDAAAKAESAPEDVKKAADSAAEKAAAPSQKEKTQAAKR